MNYLDCISAYRYRIVGLLFVILFGSLSCSNPVGPYSYESTKSTKNVLNHAEKLIGSDSALASNIGFIFTDEQLNWLLTSQHVRHVRYRILQQVPQGIVVKREFPQGTKMYQLPHDVFTGKLLLLPNGETQKYIDPESMKKLKMQLEVLEKQQHTK